MSKSMSLTYWEFPAPRKTKNVSVDDVDHFDARGMLRVYGRGDHFTGYCTFNLDIWLTKDDRLLMRCWSRYMDIDGRSFEIKGLDTSKIPKPEKNKVLDELWVPDVVRKTYEEWIQAEY